MRLPAARIPILLAAVCGCPLAAQIAPRAATQSAPQVAATATLKAAHPVVSQFEDGQPVDASQPFVPGETLFFSFVAEGYKTGDTGQVGLTAHFEAFDPAGVPIMPRDEEVIGTTLSQEDKGWIPKFRTQFQLPSIAPPGSYRIRYEVADQQSGQSTSGEFSFRVTGHAVERSAGLAVRGLSFYRTQDDQTALKAPAYRPGDFIWVRCDITGYRYGEQNAVDVSYDVTVLTPAGKPLFVQENAASEKSQAFYPQPWVPVEFNITLQPNTPGGMYAMVITAHDNLGHQTAEARAEFRVQE